MIIKITLIGSLCKYFQGEKNGSIELPTDAAAEDILNHLGIPTEYCSFMMVKGQKVPRTYLLEDGDEVVVFPLVSGG